MPAQPKIDVTYVFPLHTRIMSRCWGAVRWLPVVGRLYWRLMWVGATAEIQGQSRDLRPVYPEGWRLKRKLNGSASSRGS